MVGMAAAATTSPSGQYMCSSTAVTTVTCKDVDDQEQQPETHEAADRAQVDGHPRQQLAALPATVELHRQRLHVPVEVVADRGLEAEHGMGLDPSPDQDQAGLGDPERQGQQTQRQDRADLAGR